MKVSVGALNMLKLKSGKNMLEIWAIFEFSLGLGFMKVSNLCSAQDSLAGFPCLCVGESSLGWISGFPDFQPGFPGFPDFLNF